MAYTGNNIGVGNSIALAEAYLPILDEVYKAESKTSVLDATGARVKFTGGNKIELFKISSDGLGNYSRNNGFVTGDVTGTWEPHTLEIDRGRGFLVDEMDSEESLGLAFGALAGEFLRTKVVPEIDAYAFSKIAGTTGITTATPADLSSSSDVPALISEAEYQMSEDEVPEEGRIMFVSENAYRYLKDKIARMVLNGENGIQTAIETYDGMRLIRVPSARFATAITLYDGTTSGQEAGGYVKTAGGYDINFMIVDPNAVAKVVKHEVPRIFAPQVNQLPDAYLFQYRIYHDLFVYANKVKGIYLHRAATANT
jgi:hypothetical protein